MRSRFTLGTVLVFPWKLAGTAQDIATPLDDLQKKRR